MSKMHFQQKIVDHMIFEVNFLVPKVGGGV